MTDTPHTEPLPELPCRDLVEVVTAYLEGGLSDSDRVRFELHLGVCGECVAYVEQIRATILITSSAGGRADDAFPHALREDVRRAFQSWSG